MSVPAALAAAASLVAGRTHQLPTPILPSRDELDLEATGVQCGVFVACAVSSWATCRPRSSWPLLCPIGYFLLCLLPHVCERFFFNAFLLPCCSVQLCSHRAIFLSPVGLFIFRDCT